MLTRFCILFLTGQGLITNCMQACQCKICRVVHRSLTHLANNPSTMWSQILFISVKVAKSNIGNVFPIAVYILVYAGIIEMMHKEKPFAFFQLYSPTLYIEIKIIS